MTDKLLSEVEKKGMGVHFSSQRLDWKTPKAVYQVLDAEFSFDHDPCPTKPKVDGLQSEWGASNYVNPPYGRELPKWVQKAYEQYQRGKTVVMLIPSRTDTRWWHDYCMRASEIRFIKGRLKFDEHENSAPFPSAIVIFRPTSLKLIEAEKVKELERLLEQSVERYHKIEKPTPKHNNIHRAVNKPLLDRIKELKGKDE